MGTRFVLWDEIQRCLWSSAESMPEVDIAMGSELDQYADQDSAMAAALKLLSTIGATATYADVRPIEECAKCGADFDTSRGHHHVLVVSEESGPETAPEELNVWYVARFCPSCCPPEDDLLLKGGL